MSTGKNVCATKAVVVARHAARVFSSTGILACAAGEMAIGVRAAMQWLRKLWGGTIYRASTLFMDRGATSRMGSLHYNNAGITFVGFHTKRPIFRFYSNLQHALFGRAIDVALCNSRVYYFYWIISF